MALFENRYKAAAATEIERDLRRLEEKDKRAQSFQDYLNDHTATVSNIGFAERIDLISSEQAASFRERAAAAKFELFERMESRIVVNDFENPLERALRFQSMDECAAKIESERSSSPSHAHSGHAEATRQFPEERAH